jgi:hypothetical protein
MALTAIEEHWNLPGGKGPPRDGDDHSVVLEMGDNLQRLDDTASLDGGVSPI